MRQLIRTYNITGLHEITITGYTFTKQDIRLILNETLASAAVTTEDLVASVLVSSTKKANVVSVVNGVITLASTTAALTVGDELTIEIDIDNIAKEALATVNKTAIINAINNIDLSTVAKESAATANKEAIIAAVNNAQPDLSSVAKEVQVKDGNDTAISVGKEVRSEVGTGSDTAAETGTLFAVVKWVKDKVKSIYNAVTDSTNGLSAIKTSAASASSDSAAIKTAIGTPASGQASTLFEAIAAGGGGGGDAQESTSQSILSAVKNGTSNNTAIGLLENSNIGLNAIVTALTALYGGDSTATLSALKTLLNAIPTTEPATTTDVNNARNVITAAIASLVVEAQMVTYPTQQMSATTAMIDPNKAYVWGEVSSLNISFNTSAEVSGMVNVYFLEFYSGVNATTLTLPASVTEVRGVINPNCIVNVGIYNNIAYIA